MSFQLDSLPKVGQSVLGYPSRLLSRTEVAKDTLAFQFQRSRNFLFRPGQFIDSAVRGVPDSGLKLTDLHVATLASLSPVDVLSTDRHTVKPWFEGKIPFTRFVPSHRQDYHSEFRGRLVDGRGRHPGSGRSRQRQHRDNRRRDLRPGRRWK